ncbi:hypothetical protein HPB47_020527 [Ixodes persulcatus]|uniref:Uncharacterized protein n=1 Tax=Ixodes persulcatus TaxID=34615 RepID=A0AC60QHB8_IXOPE|nr:hypothetical protein HPB47_020527 [Ixodes persulcatus]
MNSETACCCLSVYVVDTHLRATARGFVAHKYSYLRDIWSCLDFIVTLTGIAELLIVAVGASPSALRFLRPFRLLKIFTIFHGLKLASNAAGMRAIVTTIIHATTRMFEVVVLLFFCIAVFAMLGLQMFMLALKQRCVVSRERLGVLDDLLYSEMVQNTSLWMGIGDRDQAEDADGGGNGEEPLGFVCGNVLAAYHCEVGFSCEPVLQVENERVFPSFDNIFDAILTTFNIFTLDSWELPYNMVSTPPLRRFVSSGVEHKRGWEDYAPGADYLSKNFYFRPQICPCRLNTGHYVKVVIQKKAAKLVLPAPGRQDPYIQRGDTQGCFKITCPFWASRTELLGAHLGFVRDAKRLTVPKRWPAIFASRKVQGATGGLLLGLVVLSL